MKSKTCESHLSSLVMMSKEKLSSSTVILHKIWTPNYMVKRLNYDDSYVSMETNLQWSCSSSICLLHMLLTVFYLVLLLFLMSFIWSIFIEPTWNTRPIFCGSHWASLAYHLIQTKPLKNWDDVEGNWNI